MLGFIPLENLNKKTKKKIKVCYKSALIRTLLTLLRVPGAAAGCTCECVCAALCLLVRHPCVGDAYLPGCELCGISASALSTGRTASWTCYCSRRRVSSPSQRTASAPDAGWSWNRHWTWSRRSQTGTVLETTEGGEESEQTLL